MLLNQHYIIKENKRQGGTQLYRYDKIIPCPVTKGASTDLATETVVSPMVGS